MSRRPFYEILRVLVAVFPCRHDGVPSRQMGLHKISKKIRLLQILCCKRIFCRLQTRGQFSAKPHALFTETPKAADSPGGETAALHLGLALPLFQGYTACAPCMACIYQPPGPPPPPGRPPPPPPPPPELPDCVTVCDWLIVVTVCAFSTVALAMNPCHSSSPLTLLLVPTV